MSSKITLPDFDQLADMYWRLGVMQSPSQLQGYLVGQLAVGDRIEPEQWPAQAASFIDAVEPPNAEEAQLLLSLYAATQSQLVSGEMDLQLLLPDDVVDIGQRADCLGQWCQGFLVGFAQGGKAIKAQQGLQQYSSEVSEALSDIAAISQIDLSADDTEAEQRDQNLFEICEYLRMAAITIYLECTLPAVKQSLESEAGSETPALGSLNNLFSRGDNKLH